MGPRRREEEWRCQRRLRRCGANCIPAQEEEAAEEEEETEEEQHAAITPATANRNKEKFRLHRARMEMFAAARVVARAAFNQWNKVCDCEEDGDDNDREERKTLRR